MGFDVAAYAKKIVNAKPAGSGNPIRDGKFTMILRKLELKPSDKGGSELWFIAEFVVLKSEPVDVPPNMITADKPVTAPNAVGSDCSIVVDFNSQMGPANIKEVMAADLNLKHEQITEDQVVKWLQDNVETPGGNPAWIGKQPQPLQGRAFGCTTTRTITKTGKNAGKPGTRPRWSYIEQTPAELQGLREFVQPKA